MLTQVFILLVQFALVQAVVLVMLILGLRQKEKIPQLLLSVLVFDFSLALLGTALVASGKYHDYPHFMGIAEPFYLIPGPVFYLYARYLSGNKPDWKASLHFLPFILVILAFIPFYQLSAAEKIEYASEAWDHRIIRAEILGFHAMVFSHILIYGLFSLGSFQSNEDKSQFSWLRGILRGLVVTSGIAVILYMMMIPGWISYPQTTMILAIVVAILIYATGYLGFRYARNTISETVTPENGPIASEERTGMDQELVERYMKRLEQQMITGKAFMEPDLTLGSLAEKTGIQPYLLSQLLNEHVGKNFSDYVNEFRVEEISKRLRSTEYEHLTILAIAMDCGFQTKSAFNQAFKKFTGTTPSNYRKTAFS